jgi:hypothetical protein
MDTRGAGVSPAFLQSPRARVRQILHDARATVGSDVYDMGKFYGILSVIGWIFFTIVMGLLAMKNKRNKKR